MDPKLKVVNPGEPGRGGNDVSPAGSTLPLEAGDDFVITPLVQALTERARTYLKAGYAVHLAGPAGTGKTTLAFHIAAGLGRAVTLVHGDDDLAASDLVGHEKGFRRTSLVDNFVRSVVKTSDELHGVWADSRLTRACQNGDTLIYDEFSRSRPEANNALLSILAERLLSLPRMRGNDDGDGLLAVHPDFRAIFTSNPEEYAGVHKTQDALQDRMITIQLGHYDRETEVRIVMAKSGLGEEEASIIVELVREMRERSRGCRPSIRAAIAIARILANEKATVGPTDPVFHWVARDVLTEPSRDRGESTITPGIVAEAIRTVCARLPSNALRASAGAGALNAVE